MADRRQDTVVFALAQGIQGAVLAWLMASGYLQAYNFVVSFGDPISHLNVARRVFDSSTPGLSQLGGIWLPLPHLLFLPLALDRSLWLDGLSGALVNALLLSLTTVYMARIARMLADRWAAYLVVPALLLNSRTLVLSATAMTEISYIFFSALSAYYFLRWAKEKRWQDLVATGVITFLATLTRYEGWALPVIYTIAAAYILFRDYRGHPVARKIIEGHLMTMAPSAFLGPLAWLLWNAIIFRDPFHFITGAAAASESKVVGGVPLDPGGAVVVFANSTLLYFGPALLCMAMVGTAGHWRLTGRKDLPFMFLLVSPVFVTLFALTNGQASGPFGVVDLRLVSYLAPPVALGLAVLPFLLRGVHRRRLALGLVLLVITCTFTVEALSPFHQITPYSFNPQISPDRYLQTFDDTWPYHEAGVWLGDHYDYGTILVGVTGGKEIIMYYSGLDLRTFIDNGNRKYFQPALVEPRSYAAWVIMSKRPLTVLDDPVARAWLDSTTGRPRVAFLDAFSLRFQNAFVAIYHIKPEASVPPASAPSPLAPAPLSQGVAAPGPRAFPPSPGPTTVAGVPAAPLTSHARGVILPLLPSESSMEVRP